jgi:hypothetical protein
MADEFGTGFPRSGTGFPALLRGMFPAGYRSLFRSRTDHLSYDATIEDPRVFSRPWKIRMPLYRRVEPNI